MAGQVPENTDAGLGDDDYTCNFGFQQAITDSGLTPPNDDIFDSGGSPVTDPLSCGYGNTCHIIAGSNSIEPIEVTVNNIDPSGDIQTKLENAASPEATSVFNPFPTGGSSPGAEPRNPLFVCQRDHGCPTYN